MNPNTTLDSKSWEYLVNNDPLTYIRMKKTSAPGTAPSSAGEPSTMSPPRFAGNIHKNPTYMRDAKKPPPSVLASQSLSTALKTSTHLEGLHPEQIKQIMENEHNQELARRWPVEQVAEHLQHQRRLKENLNYVAANNISGQSSGAQPTTPQLHSHASNVDPGAASRQELQQYHDRHASFPPLNPAFDRLGNLVGCFNNEDQLVLLNQLPLAIRSRLQQQVDLARITAERERMAISQRQMLDQYRLGYKSQVDGHTFQNIMGFNPSYPVPPFHGVSSSDLQHGLFLPPAPNGRRDEPAPHKPIQHENDHRLVQHSRLQNTSEEQHSISARSEAMARSCDHDRVDQQIYIIPVFVPFRDGGYGSQRMSAHGDAHAMGSVAQYGGSDPSHSHNSRQLAIEFEHEGSSYQESRSTSGSNESADNFEPCSIPSAHEIREQFKQGVLSSISDAKIGSGEDQRAAVGPSVRREQFKNEFLSQLSTSMGGSGQARGNSSRPIHLSDLPGSLGEPESMASQVQNKRRDSIRIIEVDNSDDLVELLNIIGLPSPHVQELFFDMEGDLLSWNGPISIMQVSMASYPGVTWIIDVYRLGIETAFDTQGSLGQSLRNILTDSSIPTVWYDVRQDSWALAGQVGIKIGQAVDLQLMVHGAVECTGLTLMGLDKCVERFLTLSPEQQAEWRNGKRTGREYLNNDFSRWMMRPLPKPLRVYAAGDTVHMPQMYKQSLLILRRDLQLIQLVIELSQQRVDNTQVPNFASSGPIAPPEFAGLHRRRYGGHRSSS